MRSLAASASLAIVLLAAACADSRTSPLPSAPRPAAAALSTAPYTCDFVRMRADAQAYFASPTDVVFDIITELQNLRRAGPASPAATHKAFDGIARIANVRGTSAQKAGSTPEQGAALTRDFMACMQTRMIGAPPSAAALASALGSGGLFAVRGGPSDPATGGVFSADLTPAWGAAPQASSSWAVSSGGKRFLIYGSPVTPSAALFLDPLATPVGFDFHTAPAGLAFSPKLIVGTCVPPSPTVRIQHVTTVLPLDPTLDCTAPLTTASAEGARASGLSAALHAIGDFFSPTPAYAAFLVGGTAGLSGSFSEYAAITAPTVTASVVGQPLTATVNVPVPGASPSGFVEVRVTTNGGTPLGGAVVTLSIATGPVGAAASGTTATTGADGRAVFSAFTLNKIGFYTVSAASNFDGIVGAPVVTNTFEVRLAPGPGQ